jgi:hypothetical protein
MTVHASGLLEIVGESHRQDALKLVATKTTGSAQFLNDLSGHARKVAQQELDGRWFRAVLIREPDNPVDRNAIAVFADGVGRIGYLTRDDAIDYQVIFDALKRHNCTVASCPAFLIGGVAGKPSFGAMLCLSSAELICSNLAETPAQ